MIKINLCQDIYQLKKQNERLKKKAEENKFSISALMAALNRPHVDIVIELTENF